MKLQNANGNVALVIMNYEEIYTILQCVAEVKARLENEDDDTIVGANKATLRALAKELNNIKDLVGRSN